MSGRKAISTFNSYSFPRHSTGTESVHYKWTNQDGSTQLNLLSDDSIPGNGQYLFDFEPQNYSGLTSIKSALLTTGFDYQLEDAESGTYYIRNTQGLYAYFDTTTVNTQSFRNQASPPHIGIQWKHLAQFQATSIKSPYKWYIENQLMLNNIHI